MAIVALDRLAEEGIIHPVANRPAHRANESNRHGPGSFAKEVGRIQNTSNWRISQRPGKPAMFRSRLLE
jgi:hypothetical protein